MSTIKLSNEFGLRQKTCWDFKWKLQKVMKSSKQHLLGGEIHIDEFLIGRPEERTKGKKKLVILALENVTNGFCRAYAQVIELCMRMNKCKV